jgi:hypothetical protein
LFPKHGLACDPNRLIDPAAPGPMLPMVSTLLPRVGGAQTGTTGGGS